MKAKTLQSLREAAALAATMKQQLVTQNLREDLRLLLKPPVKVPRPSKPKLPLWAVIPNFQNGKGCILVAAKDPEQVCVTIQKTERHKHLQISSIRLMYKVTGQLGTSTYLRPRVVLNCMHE